MCNGSFGSVERSERRYRKLELFVHRNGSHSTPRCVRYFLLWIRPRHRGGPRSPSPESLDERLEQGLHDGTEYSDLGPDVTECSGVASTTDDWRSPVHRGDLH